MKILSFFLIVLCYTSTLFAQNLDKMTYEELDSMAYSCFSNGFYDKALIYLNQGKDKALEEFGKMDTTYLEYVANIGFIYSSTNNYKLAEKYMLEALDLRKQLSGETDPKYLILLNNIAGLYRSFHKYEESEELHRQVIDIYQKNQDIKDPVYGRYLNNLALVYEKMGRYSESEYYYLKAKELWAVAPGKTHPLYATVLNNLAGLYKEIGKKEQAESFYLEAKEILKQTSGVLSPNYSTCLHNLANLYNKMGRYKEALEYINEVLDSQKKSVGEGHITYIKSLTILADVYANMKKIKEAEETLLKAAKICQKLEEGKDLEYAYILGNLGYYYMEENKFEKAYETLIEAIRLKTATLGKEHPLVASSYNGLSELFLKKEVLDTALNYCINALDANSLEIDSAATNAVFTSITAYTFYNNSTTINTLENVLTITYKQSIQNPNPENYNALFNLCQSALEFNKSFRNTFSGSKDKLNLSNNNHFIATHALKAATYLGTQKNEAAFVFVEENKAILLMDATKANRARTMSDLPDSLALKELNLKQALDELEKQKAASTDLEEKTSINNQINEVSFQIDAFKKDLESKYPKYFKLKYQNITATVQNTQKLLDEESLFLEFFITESIVYLFAIDKNTVQLYPLPIQNKDLVTQIKNFRNALTNYKELGANPKIAYQNYIGTAYWFYDNLLKKALSTNKNYKKLILVTDGELGHLPFEAFLMKPANEQSQDYTKLAYLNNQYQVSYNYSATLWKEIMEMPLPQNNASILAIAAEYKKIDFDSLRSSRAEHLKSLRNALIPLPAAEEEVRKLGQQFGGDVLVSNNANEAYFKKNASNYAVIHLAMHGILNSQTPILSSLAFTENLDSIEDNFLEAWEIAHLQLNANLVVLSACETGYGKFQQGEGVMSLARSFMYAGVPSLVVSLWQVNDYSTSVIMTSFYQHLSAGMTKDAALRQAKLDYLQQADGIAAHPAFWSPFIQLGDSRAIVLKTKGGFSWWIIIGGLCILGIIGLVLAKRSKLKETV